MRLNDFALGLLVSLLGVVILHAASDLPTARHIRFGPGFLPSLVAIGLIMCGGTLMLRDLVAHRRLHIAVTLPDWFHDPAQRRAMLSLLVAMVCYPLLLSWAGFLIATALFLMLLFRIGGWPVGRSAAWAIAVTLVVHVVFVELLRVPMPKGLLDGLQPSLMQLLG